MKKFFAVFSFIFIFLIIPFILLNPDGKVIVTVALVGSPPLAVNIRLLLDVEDTMPLLIISCIGVSLAA